MIHSTTDATTRSLFSYRSEACAGMCMRRLGRLGAPREVVAKNRTEPLVQFPVEFS
jgi:hypothetical protein